MNEKKINNSIKLKNHDYLSDIVDGPHPPRRGGAGLWWLGLTLELGEPVERDANATLGSIRFDGFDHDEALAVTDDVVAEALAAFEQLYDGAHLDRRLRGHGSCEDVGSRAVEDAVAALAPAWIAASAP